MRTPPSFAEVHDVPLDSDEALLARVSALVGHAVRRQFWLMFLDERSRQLPVLIPSYIPRRPQPEHELHFAGFVDDLVGELDAAAIVFVLERRGGEELTEADRQWLDLATAACRTAGIPLRGPMLCHDRGVRWVAGEDLSFG